MIAVGDATRLPLPDDSVDMVMCSPPYCDARTYGIGAQRDCVEWVEWMLDVVTECRRVSRGPVIVVAAGVTRKRNYWPACEGLMWEWWRRGGDCQLYRPCFYHRVGIPGSGGNDWFRADTEYVMCFKGPGALPWSDNTAMGHPPKWAPGGEMSYRNSEGTRRNQWGGSHASDGRSVDEVENNNKGKRPSHRFSCGDNLRANGVYKKKRRLERGNEKGGCAYKQQTRRKANGDRLEDGLYVPPPLANPGNVIHLKVGGGLMGHELAHENEAPYPLKLAEWFVLSCCPPGGTVLDPFSGSGTTAHAAVKHGRKYVAIDLRQSQAELTRRRVRTVTPELFAGVSP